jgi:hypothetical protein
MSTRDPSSVVADADAAGDLGPIAKFLEREGIAAIICEYLRNVKCNRGRTAKVNEFGETDYQIRCADGWDLFDNYCLTMDRGEALKRASAEIRIDERVLQDVVTGGRAPVRKIRARRRLERLSRDSND